MNNKGVTLVELLIVIVVLGIISAFAIPAVGSIISNTEKGSTYNDAVQIENAAKLHCQQVVCNSGTNLVYDTISGYISGFPTANYVETSTGSATDTVASWNGSSWEVNLEAVGTNSGDWEWRQTAAPSSLDKDSVQVDDED